MESIPEIEQVTPLVTPDWGTGGTGTAVGKFPRGPEGLKVAQSISGGEGRGGIRTSALTPGEPR